MDHCNKKFIFYLLILVALFLLFGQSFNFTGGIGQIIYSVAFSKNISSDALNYSEITASAIDSKTAFIRKIFSGFKLSNVSISNTNFLSSTNTDPFCGYFVRAAWGGRLGNQMFMYASFYGMVKKQEKIAKKSAFVQVRNRPYDMLLQMDEIFENLSIPQKMVPDSWFGSKNFVGLNEAKVHGYNEIGLDRLSCDGKNFIVDGYRCSFRYFDHVYEGIKKEFTFKKSIREECRRLVDGNLIKKGLNRKSCVTVGVHLRRGDFARQDKMDFGHWPAQIDYLKKAIRYHETLHLKNGTDKSGCLAFFIFGNDYAWNLNAVEQVELLRPNKSHLIAIKGNETKGEIDLCAIGLCDHVIMSTGSFSWWAAWLSRGVVTYQKEFARPNSFHYSEYEPNDYFLPHWIGL